MTTKETERSGNTLSPFEAFGPDAPYFSRVNSIREEREWIEKFNRQQMEWEIAVAIKGFFDQVFPAPDFDGVLVEDLKDDMGAVWFREWEDEDRNALESIRVHERVNEKINEMLGEGIPMPSASQRQLMLECELDTLRGYYRWNINDTSEAIK